MINKKEYALLIVKEYCNAFYNERNLNKSLKFLDDKVFWTGPNKISEITTLAQLKSIFIIDFSIIKKGFKITPSSEKVFEINHDIYNIQYNFKISNSKLNLDLDISLFSTILYKNDKPKIVTIKFEYIKEPKIASNTISQHLKGGLIVTKFENPDYIYIESINNHFCKLFKINQKDKEKLLYTNIFEYIHSNDVSTIKHQLNNNDIMDRAYTYKTRVKVHDYYVNTISTVVRKKEKNGLFFYIITRPIEEKINIPKDIKFKNKKQLESMFYYHENFIDDNFSIKKVSDSFYKLLGYEKKEFFHLFKNNYLKLIHEEDQKYVSNIYKKAIPNKCKKYIAYRLIKKDNTNIWIKETLNYKERENKQDYIYSFFEEIDYLNKATKNEIQNDIFENNKIDSKFFSVDLVNRKLDTSVFDNSEFKFPNKYIANIPNSLIEKNIIYKDDKKSFLTFFENILKKQQNTWVGRVNIKNNKIGWYQLNCYTLFNNKMPIKALCILVNINNYRNLIKKFNKHQELIKTIISDYEFVGEYDSFTNKPILMYSPQSKHDFYETSKLNNFDYLINNVFHKDDIEKVLNEKNKTFHHTYNGTLPENNEFTIRYRSISNRFENYQLAHIKYIYHFDNITKHLHTIILIKNIELIKKHIDILGI